MTRSLWVTNDLPPRLGGIEQFLGNLLHRLDPAATRVLASRWPGDRTHDDAVAYDVQRVGSRPLLPTPSLLRRIRREIAEFRPDVVVFGAAWPLAELAAHIAVPTIAMTHGHEAGIVRVGGGPVVRHALRGVTTVAYISDFTQRALQPWVGDAALVHLPPGVDTEVFTPGRDVDVRERHGIGADAPLVVSIGRLVRRKGFDVLVDAWPRVMSALPGARLLIGGDGPLAAHLRTRVAELALGHAVVMAGAIESSQLARYHRAADVFAMPCRTRLAGLDVEGLGIVYLEAQACGVPVIAGRSGGAPEALAHGETGLVVDGTDRRAVADAVTALLRDDERRAAMATAGRSFVEQRFAWPVIAQRLDDVFQQTTAAATRG